MISAAPTFGTSALDLFRLALTMAQAQNEAIPQSLKEYFIYTLREAKKIAQDPHNIPSNISPEIIELAVDILNGRFNSELEEIEDFNQITPDLAKYLLENMEVTPVYKDRFNPLAGFSN